MRAPQKREKRESGRTWRDYTADEDFDEATRPPGEGEESPAADGAEKPDGEISPDAADTAPGDTTEDGDTEPADSEDTEPEDIETPVDDDDDDDLH
jgi:hypothetical protein